MSLIKTKTDDQRLILISAPKITSGNKNVDQLSVSLDGSWSYNGLNIKARFHKENSESFIVEMNNNVTEYLCRIPDEVEALPGILYIGIFGEADGSIVKTTNEIHLTILPGTETTGQIITSLLPEIIAILRRTISSAISTEISEEEAKSIIETNLADLTDLKAAYSQLVLFVNQYQHTEFSNEDLSAIAEVCRNMWDLGVQLSNAQGDNQRLREALDRYMNTMSAGTDFRPDGQIDVIIDEVGSELDNLIAELEAAKASNDAVKSVFENFYIGDDEYGNT